MGVDLGDARFEVALMDDFETRAPHRRDQLRECPLLVRIAIADERIEFEALRRPIHRAALVGALTHGRNGHGFRTSGAIAYADPSTKKRGIAGLAHSGR